MFALLVVPNYSFVYWIEEDRQAGMEVGMMHKAGRRAGSHEDVRQELAGKQEKREADRKAGRQEDLRSRP